MSYFDIYRLRLNRYGIDYQSRIQGEREDNFSKYLLKTIYRVDFYYDNILIHGSFEKYKQDETKTLHYLLTESDIVLPNGAILMIEDKNGVDKPWMVLYLDEIKARGYNKYIMLRMTHYLTWKDASGASRTSWSYFCGTRSSLVSDAIKSSTGEVTFLEDNNKIYFILPKNQYIKKDTYFEVGEAPYRQYYRVTGYDLQTLDGVEYVTIDPVYKYDTSSAPVVGEGESTDNYFWFTGGDS